MKLPQPSAWRYTHRDYAGNFVGYTYDTEKPKNLHHPNYTPMFTAAQISQYGQMCFDEGRDARAMVEPMTDVADRFAHRLALELECVLSDRNVNWNRAMNLIGEYRSAMNEIHEQHSPTHMGEPVLTGFGRKQNEGNMTKDDIIRMAGEAGFEGMTDHPALMRFAHVVAAHKAEVITAEAYRCGYKAGMEAGAVICESLAMQQDRDVRDDCAAAIRARGNT